jgi:hypothetical protein
MTPADLEKWDDYFKVLTNGMLSQLFSADEYLTPTYAETEHQIKMLRRAEKLADLMLQARKRKEREANKPLGETTT